MSALSGHAEDYLRLRRALGFKLERAGQLLPQLVAYLEAAGAGTVTSDLAIAWARLPDATPNHWAQRLAIARGFARYLQTIDRRPRCHRPGCSPPGGTGPAPACSLSATSAASWMRPVRCARHCAPLRARRSSG
jgi:integrase/recombinase XerD